MRLPPDTEIIKYTSSIVGPKIPGSTSRGRKKTISETEQQQQQATQKQQHQAEQQQQQQHLTQQQQQQQKDLESTTNAISSLLAFPGLSPAKRARLEMEYAAMAAAAQQQQHLHGMLGAAGMPMGLGMTPMEQLSSVSKAVVSAASSSSTVTSTAGGSTAGHSQSHSHNQNASSDRVEVIKLPPTITSNGAYNLSSKGCGKELHDLTGDPALASGVNLSLKSSGMPASGAIGSASNPITIDDFDAPLNLSMKPSDKSSGNNVNSTGGSSSAASSSTAASALGNLASDYQAGQASGGNGSNSLQSLSSITAALGGTGGMPGGSISGSGSGAGGASPSPAQSSLPVASGTSSSGSGSGSSTYKEGRPRNLGRGVSKPKKNTVASLLAQSRAVGLKPMLATQQLLQQGADIVR